jgi:hypothetical protein
VELRIEYHSESPLVGKGNESTYAPQTNFFQVREGKGCTPRREKPAVGAAGGPTPAGLLWRACEGLDLADSRATAGRLTGTVRTPEQQSSPGLRLGPGGLGLSLP